jgi:hypothetical protein
VRPRDEEEPRGAGFSLETRVLVLVGFEFFESPQIFAWYGWNRFLTAFSSQIVVLGKIVVA